MEDVNIEEVRAAAAVAVASTLVDNVQRERRDNSGKVFKYPPPPPFIRAVLLIQAFVRRRAFLRSFGQPASGEIDEEILELAPPRPLMSLALNFVRRLKSFRWVNVEREATLVAGLVDAQAARITMRDVSAVVNYYQDKVPKDHLSLNVLQEALDRQVIVAKEALQERASTLTTPVAIVEAMEQVIEEFQVPPEREDRVLDQTRLRLKRIVSEAEESLRKELAESSTTPAIDAVGARLREEFGPVASAVEEEIKVARLRRVQFLEMELETRWARPFVGPLPPHSAAARRYELELGKKNPKVIAFVAEETAHAATLEADLEVELSTLQKKVRELMKKRMEARARALIQDFDEKLADTFAQVQEVIEKASVNIGPDNPKVKKRAQELLSPEAMMSLPLQEGQESAPATKPAPEPLPEASQRAEFPEEFADINLEPPLPPPSEGPLPAPPMETQRPAEKQREILQGGRAEMDPDLELEDEDLWGEPVGFSELISINDQVWDPRKLELEEEKARISFEPDPQQVLHLTALAAEDDSPEMEQKRADQAQLERERGEQKERTAVLTLEDLTMDTVAMHTEDVFKLKFIRSIAEALQIPKHRVKVNGFAPGSVKVLLSILEPTGDEPDDEDGRSRISADRALEELFAQVEDPNSRLRLGEVGPFVAAARLDRDIIPSAQVNVGSMADAYLASSLQGDDFELSDPWGESTAKRSEEVVDTAEQMAQTAQQSVGTRWGSSRMEHGSLQAESQFRSTCPHSKEDGTLAAWAIPYEKQPMYTFYDKSSEQIAKESLVRLPQDKVKVTMTASFHLTRHPASGTDTLKGKVPPAGGVKVFSADTWLDKEHLGMKDPTIRPGDVDLEETMKKKTDTLLPSDEEEEVAPAPDTPQRPTSATSTSVASDASSNTRKRKGSKKKRGKKGEDSQELSGDGQATSPEDSRETPEGAETGSKTGSLEDAEADSDAGRKTPKTPKKKAGKKKGAAGADDMGQTADSFASVASMATDESEADSPKAARKKKAEATQKAKAKSKDGRRASEGRRTSETIKVEAPPPVMGSADAEDEVMVPGKDASAKSRASPKRAGHSPKRQADKKNPAEGGKDMPDNLDGLGGSFATQFCWAGMYGGMNGTGLRPRWKDNPRLPQLVGKPATDDLHTPCFVRHAYRHGTVTVGPPYKVAEAFDQTSPAWCAAKMLDASIQKADWVRSYSKILQERDPKLGPDVNIRVASRSFSLPKVAARAKPRARPTARSASADRLPEDGKKDRRASRGSDVVHEGGTQVADAIDTSLGKPSSKTPKTKHEEEDKKKKKDKDKKKKEKKKGKGDEDGDDEGKKKKDKKKKDKKKDKGETGDLDDSGIVAEELGDGASEAGEPPFELLPSVGTWLTPLFLEPEELEEVARPGTGESSDYQQSVGESDFSATFGTEAVVADNVLAAAFGDVPYRVLQLPVPKADSATGEEASESSTVIGAQAAIVHAIQQAALAEEQMQGEAGQPQEAVDTPFQFRPSSGTMMLPLPQVAWELPQESEVVPPAASRDPTVVSEHPPGSEVVPPASRDPTVVSEHPPGSEVVPPASRDPTVVSEHPPGSEVAPQASRDPTVVSAHASGSEASVNSAVIGAQAAISHAIAQAARSEEARQGTQAESVISAAPAPSRPRSEIAEPPFEFLPSVAVSMLPLPYKVAVPVVAVPVEVYEPPAPEPPRMPVKRTPFTNAGAARREVSNFASSLTTSIFRDAKLGKRGYRGSSRSPSPGLGPPPQPADGGYPQGRSTDSSTAFASSQPPAEKAPLPGPPRTRPTEEPMQRPSLAATTPAGLAPRLQINAIPIKEGEEGL